jgi:23S rRNA pseudouridine1911/1915/1917 synthase
MNFIYKQQRERLDLVIHQELSEHSRSMIQKIIKSGQVCVNHSTITSPKHQVLTNDLITVDLSPLQPRIDEAQPIKLDVIHEDDAILIIHKPPGLTVHPGAGQADSTLLNAILFHYPKNRDLPQAGMVHRLDKDTSGLLIIAKDLNVHSKLSKMMHDRQIKKTYLALVHGRIHQPRTIEEPIARHPTNRQKFSVHPSGRNSITHFTIKERFEHYTLLEIDLETGRTHQIRVHMEHIGHPLIGDLKYGSKKTARKNQISPELLAQLTSFKRQALHAYKLEFIHPVTRKKISVSCHPPEDFTKLLKLLRP